MIGTNKFDIKGIVSNDPYDIEGTEATRNNTKSGDFTEITI